MSDTLTLSGGDRLLIIAPHPDDESIATGGLLQVALAAGATVRVVVLTDGDNNPWPQRWVEKRWRVGAADRARWGGRRREEARGAMCLLGIAESSTHFLGLPDLGLTDLLMRADAEVLQALAAEIGGFRPTLLTVPALCDRHPDHSAAFILTTLALAGSSASLPRLLTFAVHGVPDEGGTGVDLSPDRRDVKRAAIQAHASQMRLSRRRFLRYAQPREWYRWQNLPPGPDVNHPVRARVVENGLDIHLDTSRWDSTLRGHALFVVMGDGSGAARRLVTLGRNHALVQDYLSGTASTQPLVRSGDSISFALPLGRSVGHAGYVKLARPQPGLFVLDRRSWQVIG